jgi:hypothetical protein
MIVLNFHAPTEDKTDYVKDSFYEELERVYDKFTKYHMKILLGDFKGKVGREDMFKLTFGNGGLQELSNDNGARLVNFATSKNLRVKSTIFPHSNIHKHAWTYFNILNKLKNYFSQLFDVYNVGDVKQIEEYAAEPIASGLSRLKMKLLLQRLKSINHRAVMKFPVELFQTGCETQQSGIHKLINSVRDKEELHDQWMETTVPVHKKGDKTRCNNYHGISLPSTSYTISLKILLSRLSQYIY